MSKTLHFDVETRSTVDLRKTGAYLYAKHSDTAVILAAWAIDDAPVRWAFIDGGDTSELQAALADPSIAVAAHNAQFERLMLTHVLGPRHGWPVPALERFDCTAARAARQSLPRSLDGAGAALGLSTQKDKSGHLLMLQLCKPRKPRMGEDPNAILWWDDAERLQRLGEYCVVDVEVERLLDRVLKPLSPEEKEIWLLTERMNDRGVPVDLAFARAALDRANECAATLNHEMRKVTNGLVSSASNVGALKTWLRASFGVVVLDTDDDALDKAAIAKVLERDIPAPARRALEIRLEAGKTSTKKYQAIIDRADADGRARGNLVYHGASTGRWAGSGIQLQNMPRVPKKFDLTKPVEDCTLDDLSKRVRSVLVARDGYELAYADYSAVEARGVAWLAGADELVDLFASGGKVYEAMAATVFSRPAESITEDSLERFIGKTIVLGCGYGMGAAKFRETCTKQGQLITEELAKQAIAAYRSGYPQIPSLWKGLEQAAVAAVGSVGQVTRYRLIQFRVEGKWLQMRLPSGRCIWYRNPRVISVNGPYGERPCLEYDAQNSMTKKWSAESSWGGKLCENAVQAICRDLIAGGTLELERAGYTPVMSVHDEVICEVPADFGNKDEMEKLMCHLPEWAAGFPLSAAGGRGQRYGK